MARSQIQLRPFWFKPGQSGNPLGSVAPQRGLSKAIRSLTNQGRELLELLLGYVRDPSVSHVVRLKACEVLLNYGFGPPREMVDGDEESKVDLSKLTPDQMAVLGELKSIATRENVIDIQPSTPNNPVEKTP